MTCLRRRGIIMSLNNNQQLISEEERYSLRSKEKRLFWAAARRALTAAGILLAVILFGDTIMGYVTDPLFRRLINLGIIILTLLALLLLLNASIYMYRGNKTLRMTASVVILRKVEHQFFERFDSQIKSLLNEGTNG